MDADVQQLTTAVKQLIDVVKSIAAEQATVDHSGHAWGTEVLNKLHEISERLPKHGG